MKKEYPEDEISAEVVTAEHGCHVERVSPDLTRQVVQITPGE